ncbi:efflux RND transporter periplasmic adaptor subunit [Paracoccus aurantiacus]|uniref:Efflux RND transporter periplasmic adaptor subunit n=1 Tax=Paracoccus aurantiacus TaxID=2599412 RepID=A0A5C6SCM2_9RHOB|nr:efflux RND transporter periplasmic adaptor subunit [Paracoccus aurantiacus]TXB71305.1 efflux RND transporter periplasmic adaptor subunit [Paracoccus aurantiacus]
MFPDRIHRLRCAIAAAAPVVAGGVLLAPHDAHAQGQGERGPQGPSEVGVIAVSRSAVPVTVELPGRAVAFQMASIRPRVGGEITAIPYEAGAEVKAGDVLFRLEDETLAAELAADNVAVASARAALTGAQATVDRYRRLSGSGVSRAELESAEVALAAAEAGLGVAEAQRDLSQLALNRSDIASPIDGVAAVTPFSVGDIVAAGQSDPLTQVVQIDPIYVDVMESRAHVLRYQSRMADGSMAPTAAPPVARLTLETGEVYDEPGRLLSPGTQVSATTSTTTVRLQFANPDHLILPGQFVRVTMTIGQIDAFLVPQRATRRSAAGQLTAFVARDGKAVEVRLTEEGTHENAWMVTSGLQNDDALILDGLNNLLDGAEVTTVPVTIDAEGVVRDAAEPETAMQPPPEGRVEADSKAPPSGGSGGG